MGKGKGTFEYWACRYVKGWVPCLLASLIYRSRAPPGRVIFEIGGGGLREEIARDGMCESTHPLSSLIESTALKLASVRLPFRTEFITPASLPRLGNLLLPRSTPATELIPAQIPALAEASTSQCTL